MTSLVQITNDTHLLFDGSCTVQIPQKYGVDKEALRVFLAKAESNIFVPDLWLNPYFKISIQSLEFHIRGYQIYPKCWILSEMSNDQYFVTIHMDTSVIIQTLREIYKLLG